MGNSPSDDKGESNQAPKYLWAYQTNHSTMDNQEELEWLPFPDTVADKLEAAYLKRAETIEIDDYDISFTKMIQISKKDPQITTKIKREPLDSSREVRYCSKLSNPRIINPDARDYVRLMDYIERKNENAKLVAQILMDLGPIEWFPHFKDKLLSRLIESIQKEAHSELEVAEATEIVSILQTCKETQERKEDQENKEQDCKKTPDSKEAQESNEIEVMLKAQKDFYQRILKIFTKNTYLYYRINDKLRQEDWGGLGDLELYLYLLLFCFVNGDLNIANTNASVIKKYITKSAEEVPLYHGTYLNEDELEFFNPQWTTYFSWSEFVSTTKNFQFLQGFLRAKDTQDKPTIFKINTHINLTSDQNPGIIDMTNYSHFKSEEEVILPPGTVFKIVKREEINDVLCIELEVIKDLKVLKQNIMPSPVPVTNKLIEPNDCRLDYLRDEPLKEAVLEIEKMNEVGSLRIVGCDFEKELFRRLLGVFETAEIMDFTLLKTPISIEDNFQLVKRLSMSKIHSLTLDCADLSIEGFTAIVENLPKTLGRLDLVSNLTNHDNQFLTILSEVISKTGLVALKLFGFKFDCENLEKLFKSFPATLTEVVLNSNQIQGNPNNLFMTLYLDSKINSISLKNNHVDARVKNNPHQWPLDLRDMVIAQENTQSLHIYRPQYSKQLSLNEKNPESRFFDTSLQIECDYIEDAYVLGFDIMRQLSAESNEGGILLELEVRLSSNPNNEACRLLRAELETLPSLTRLNIFCTPAPKEEECINDNSIEIIAETIMRCQDLEEFAIVLDNLRITDKVMISLCEALKRSKGLKRLGISLPRCHQLTIGTVSIIGKSLLTFPELTSIRLDFDEWVNLDDEAVEVLMTHVKELPALENLILGIKNIRLTDQGLMYLSNGLRNLRKIKKLRLRIGSESVTDKGLEYLRLGIKRMVALETLSVDSLNNFPKVTPEAIAKFNEELQKPLNAEYMV